MLKIIEVLVLIGAGVCFVIWQFRDLSRAREITRKQREAEQNQFTNVISEPRESFKKRGPDGG